MQNDELGEAMAALTVSTGCLGCGCLVALMKLAVVVLIVLALVKYLGS